jgi:vancomycin resistance protein YoaR
MFTINENRIDQSSHDAQFTEPPKDMTQRIPLDGTAQPAKRPVNPQRNRKKKRWYMTKKEKITLITLGTVTAALLIAAIIMVSTMFTAPADDGRILKGVVAAGVNIGGMTPQEAADALYEATSNTYSKLNMVVTVLDSQISLSPERTGAKLDIAAVVQDAYNYGRTGSRAEQNQAKNNALQNSVIIPITRHLNLDTDYIRSEINKLGTQFSSTLTQPKLTLTGKKPAMGVAKPDTTTAHQTLTIYVGTAEYGLDTNKLYNQVLEYYNINIFQVVGTCTVVAPDSLEEDLLDYYEDLCVEPVDAQMDPVTFDITPEIYGYGFDLNKVKEQIAKAPYGTTLTIPLTYLTPNLTQDLISGNLFKDVMGSYSSALGAETAWNTNATLAAEKLNGLIIKSGDVFSFNEALGELTAENGYLEALTYRGTVAVPVIGGGVTHTASVLFNSVLQAELEILECRNHTYATNFIEVGRDVYVAEGKSDFRFRNSQPDPIRIKAEVVDGMIEISIEGTDTRDYEVDIAIQTVKTIRPGKLYNVMLSNNPGGYKNNDILVEGMNGYEVELYRSMYDKQDGSLIDEDAILTFKYDARDSVVVKLQNESPTPPATEETPDPVD